MTDKTRIVEISGEAIDIHYDKKINKLNIELAMSSLGGPIIIFQDYSNVGKSRDILTLHLKEAIALKSIIDNLVVDFITDFPKGGF